MKLLIVCQAVDRNHPILGFFHRWVIEFSKHAESVLVFASSVGDYALPDNVKVVSLGKDEGKGSFTRLARLKWLSYKHKNQYDVVFVHMIPEFIVAAGLLWKLFGKKIGLWYNHTVGSFWLKFAQPLTTWVFHTSPFAYTAQYKNAFQMPAGIDTEMFKPHPEIKKIPRSIYFQGRIAPAKNVHILLDAFDRLHKEGKADLLTLVGPEDESYTKPLREKYKNLIKEGAIVFTGSVKNVDTPQLYAKHIVSVNLTASGNYDKTVLESIMSGTPVVISSGAFSDIVPPEWIVPANDLNALTNTLQKILKFSEEQLHSLDTLERVTTAEKHSLTALGREIKVVFKM